MPSPFGKEQTWNGSFRAEDVELDFGGAGGPGALAQSAQFTCNRTVNFLYEIGSNNVYYVGNRRQGQAQFTKVVGGSTDIIQTYSNMCAPVDLTVKANGGCGGVVGGRTYILKKALLNSVGASTTAQDIVINEQLGFVFADLDVT